MMPAMGDVGRLRVIVGVNVGAGQRVTRQASGAIHVQDVHGYHRRFHGNRYNAKKKAHSRVG